VSGVTSSLVDRSANGIKDLNPDSLPGVGYIDESGNGSKSDFRMPLLTGKAHGIGTPRNRNCDISFVNPLKLFSFIRIHAIFVFNARRGGY
jgi:hypothetical protein